MMRGPSAGTWRLVCGDGVAREVPVEPDASLQHAQEGSGPIEWVATGERGTFSIGFWGEQTVLPAGWYRLRGRLECRHGGPVSPCLHVAYADGADGDADIPLPDPDLRGSVDTLVLFKYGVSQLHFCPGLGRFRFAMEAFSLTAVSRPQALFLMLFGRRRPAAWPSAVYATARFLSDAARSGLSRATVHLFQRYRQRVAPGDLGEYGNWVARFDTLSGDDLQALKQRAAGLAAEGPLISVLMPAYQTQERWLRRAIESVIGQAYGKWQLCLVDDASLDPGVLAIMQEYARRDSRIEVSRRPVNGHISEASNTALDMARGGFVSLLDHDDELRPNALLEVAEAILAHPGVELLYSDEDKVDLRGRRYDPYFKPDWDPDLLRSQNYLCHLTTVRTALVREVGGFRKGFEGSQDHDLFLRCTERLVAGQVHHIPKVLYHWRAIPGSTALTRDAKDYASAAGAQAVGGHLARCHPGASVEELTHGHYRVRWPLPTPVPKVSLVVPTRDRPELLRTCVESLLERTDYPDFELVVVDNRSTEPAALEYLARLRTLPRVRVLEYNAPFNYSAINNWAVARCDGAVVALVNNDIEVITSGWLREMAAQALRPTVGAVGAMLYYPGDTIQHAGVVLGVHGVAAHLYCGMPRGYPGHGGRARVVQSLSAVTGACLVVRRELYERVGGLDERLEVAFNDVDFCLRLRDAGYRNIWTPFAELYHHESATRGREDTAAKKRRFAAEVDFMMDRWASLLADDPAYNPNLSLQSLTCALAAPPRSRQPRAS